MECTMKLLFSVLYILCITLSLFGKNEELTDQFKARYDKVIKLIESDEVKTSGEAKVIDVKVKAILINPKEEYTEKNIRLETYVTYEMLDIYKGDLQKKDKITAKIHGGKYEINGEVIRKFNFGEAHVLLDKGDQMIIGGSINKDGYFRFFDGRSLQIPSTEAIIDHIYQQAINRKEHRIFKKNTVDPEVEVLESYTELKTEGKNLKKMVKDIRSYFRK